MITGSLLFERLSTASWLSELVQDQIRPELTNSSSIDIHRGYQYLIMFVQLLNDAEPWHPPDDRWRRWTGKRRWLGSLGPDAAGSDLISVTGAKRSLPASISCESNIFNATLQCLLSHRALRDKSNVNMYSFNVNPIYLMVRLVRIQHHPVASASLIFPCSLLLWLSLTHAGC